MSEASAKRTESETCAKTAHICVVGQGYVGLPLSVAFADAGHEVLGYDIDENKIVTLSGGTDTTGDLGDDAVAESGVDFTTDAARIAEADYVILTVPTPVDEMKNPNLAFIEGAARTVGEHVSPDTTVVLESTVYPGVTRDVMGPILEAESGLTVGEDLFLGYSPERLAPGTDRTLQEVVKIVSGSDDEVLADLAALYESIVDAGVYRAPNIETAEAAKVTENVQRDINIALMNELSIICDRLDLDTKEIIEAAGTKWNFHTYHPGLVGGHCIPVDPLYLAHGAERAGYQPKLILQSREINEYMPKHAAELTLKALNRQGKVLRNSRLLVLGLAYKPNVGDIRTSEVKGVVNALAEYDVEVVGHDPHADDDAMREYFGIEVQAELSLSGFDGVVLATPHDEFADLDVEMMAAALNDDPVLVDVLGALNEDEAVSAGFAYERL
ncbi:nucleotide sugar dehydrogenase [Halegenticoccus tardaugens]|uniref:nucleotide sugar dehydrogenase n=1 Tax=Halegenticoccus tardaugens TaxID=2071624 RepID=UPI00100AE2C2|nr:nucleotide sugar dehydrogenase [Halegenticoccus tardaugens]